MRLAKKLATMFLCICLVVPCVSMVVSAAKAGSIKLESASASVGEEVTVNAKVQVDAGVYNIDFTVEYDSTKLEFVSAPNTTEVSAGELKYSDDTERNALYRGYDIAFTFKAISGGDAEVKVSTFDIESSSDINWTVGTTTVTIGGGSSVTTDPTTDDDTTDPTTDDDTTEESADDTQDEPDVSSDAEVVISSTTTITLINDVSGMILPERFEETTVTMDGSEYPAWQDSENPDMYILYALSSNGEESLYQYDTAENTYQRFTAPEATEKAEETGLAAIFGENTKYVLIGSAAVLALLIILVIVLSVKLYNRNAELDEVYDDLDAALAEKEALKKARPVAGPVVAPVAKEEPVQIQTEDDVVFAAEDLEDEDDPEVEVEFYVQESVNEFFEEEAVEEVVAEAPVAVEKPVQKVESEEFFDDDDEFYDDLDSDFLVDFIDLED